MPSLRTRIQFYDCLVPLTKIGLPLERVFSGVLPSAFRPVSRRILDRLHNGGTLSEAFQQEALFSPLEKALVFAGEQTGNLPDAFQKLADHFREQQAFRRQLLSSFLYPMLVYHAAGPLIGVIRCFSMGVPADQAIRFSLIWLLSPWVLLFLWSLLRPLLNSQTAGNIINCLPVLGAVQMRGQLSAFFLVLGQCEATGISTADSIKTAAETCSSHLYKKRLYHMGEEQLLTGNSLSELLPLFLPRPVPEEILASIFIGESTGSLPEQMLRIGTDLQQRHRKFYQILAWLIPGIFFVFTALYIISIIFSAFSQHMSQINQLLQ